MSLRKLKIWKKNKIVPEGVLYSTLGFFLENNVNAYNNQLKNKEDNWERREDKIFDTI